MENNEISKIRIDAAVRMLKGVLTDFVPMQENIKEYAQNLTADNLEENKKLILEQVNTSLSLLEQLQLIGQRMETDIKGETQEKKYGKSKKSNS